MPCTRRLKAYRGREGGVVFSARDGFYDQHLELACGQCLDCRLRRARDWALRMQHEAREHEANSFVTLTFDDEHLPEDWSLDVRTWQLFAKRLRKRVGPFRFFHSGEYGERYLRPHYHACLFGVDFSEDRQFFKVQNGYPVFVSSLLSEVWPFGNHLIGSLTFDSACYVASYVVKKVTGDRAAAAYERVDPTTGECWSVRPEYATMSRRPGIGSRYFEEFKDEVYSGDFVVSQGRKFRPPRYYDRLLQESDGERHHAVVRRRQRVVRQAGGSDPDRDRVREKCLSARVALRKGDLC